MFGLTLSFFTNSFYLLAMKMATVDTVALLIEWTVYMRKTINIFETNAKKIFHFNHSKQ